MSRSVLAPLIEQLSKTRRVRGTVIELAGDFATVQVAGFSNRAGIRVVGGPLEVGDIVNIEWNGFEPIIYAPGKSLTTSTLDGAAQQVIGSQVPQLDPFTLGGWEIDSNDIISHDGGNYRINPVKPAMELGGATDFAVGAGIWLGKHSLDSLYKMHIGTPGSNNYFEWDGTNLTIKGSVTGIIGGTSSDTFTINSDRNDATVDLIFGRTTGGDATIRWNGSQLQVVNNDFYVNGGRFSVGIAPDAGATIYAFKTATATHYVVRGLGYAGQNSIDLVGVYGQSYLVADYAVASLYGVLARGSTQASSGTPAATNLYGVYAHAYDSANSVTTTLYSHAVYALNQHDGSGSVYLQYGVYAQLTRGAGAPAADTAYAFRSWMPANIATNVYALHTNLGNVILNDDGDPNSIFRVEGDTNQYLLYVKASTDQVVIGSSAPTTGTLFSVQGDSYAGNFVGVGGFSTSGDKRLFVNWVNTTKTGNVFGTFSQVYGRIDGVAVYGHALYSRLDQAYAVSAGTGGYFYSGAEATGGSVSGAIVGVSAVARAVSTMTVGGGLIGGNFSADSDSDANITNIYGIVINANHAGGGTVENAFGIYINSIYGATSNYAIKTSNGHVVFNDAGESGSDFRVESDGYAYMLFVDSANNAVGIAQATPQYSLDVFGQIRVIAPSTAQLLLSYDGTHHSQLGSSSGGNLSLITPGDIYLDPNSGTPTVYPNESYAIHLGSLSQKYLTLHAAELWVETLVAHNTIATIGGRILVGPTTELTSDLGSADTTMYVKHNQMVSGDIVYLEADGKVEFIQINSAPSGVGPYSYTVIRSLDPSGANDWYAGDAVFNTGQAGNGFIDLYSYAGVTSGTVGPTIVGNIRNSSTYNDWTEGWAIGNLGGLYGKSSGTYGIGLGKYQVDEYMVITNAGIEMFDAADTRLFHVWDDSGNLRVDLGEVGTADVRIGETTGIEMSYGGTKYVDLANTGVLRLGEYTQDYVEISPTDGVRMWANSTMWVDIDPAGSIDVGLVTGLHTNISASGFQVISNTDVIVDIGLGTITVGRTSWGDYVEIDDTNGVRMWSGGNMMVDIDPAPSITLGRGTNYHRVVISDNAAQFYNNSNLVMLELSTSNGVIVGDDASGDHVVINSGGIYMKDASVTRMLIESDGDVFLGSNLAAAATTYLAIFAGAQTYNTESMTAGTLLLGDNSASKANVKYSSGQMLFRGGQTTQLYIDTDGKLKAGGGVVLLDSGGIKIEIGTSWAESRSYQFTSSGTPVARLRGWLDVSGVMHTDLYEAADRDAYISMSASWAGSGNRFKNTVMSAVSGTDSASVSCYAYQTGNDTYVSLQATDRVSVTAPYFSTSIDARIGGGLMVGNTTSDPAAGRIEVPGIGSSYGLLLGTDVHLYRGAANNLYLASGDSMTLVSGNLTLTSGDLYTVAWSSYSLGWGGFTSLSGTIYYKKIGKLVWIWFQLTGTNGTGSNYINLPYASQGSADTANPYHDNLESNAVAVIDVSLHTQRLYFYKNNWAVLGTALSRTLYGQICYTTA